MVKSLSINRMGIQLQELSTLEPRKLQRWEQDFYYGKITAADLNYLFLSSSVSISVSVGLCVQKFKKMDTD